MLEIGSIVDGKYKILNKIGQGGMSVVYLAMNERANKQWAIKEVRKDGKSDFEVVRQGLIAETELLKKLNHPHLPSIIDVIDRDDTFLIVMDYIEGIALDKVLKKGPVPQEDVIEWSKQLCDVLGYLHSRQPAIIYRDMKPSNVMLKPDGNVMLIDFGTAREYKLTSQQDTVVLGTRGYAAPEQYGGLGQTDPRTDIYCLGATMYHLVTGHNPAQPPFEMYPIRRWNPRLSSGLEEIILKCTQQNPMDRYQSCAELMYALENYELLDIETKKEYKKKWRIFLGTAISGIVCMGAAMGFRGVEKGQIQSTYDYYLEKGNDAANGGDTKSATTNYASAIELAPEKKDAYTRLVDVLIVDGQLDADESAFLTSTLSGNSGKEDNIDKLKARSKAAYDELTYRLGEAYYFFYSDADAGKVMAGKWYAIAADSDTLDENQQIIAKSISNIITYGDIFGEGNVKENGELKVSYETYWDNMTALINTDAGSDVVSIRVYEYFCNTVFPNAKTLNENGISYGEILNKFNDILGKATGILNNDNALPTSSKIKLERLISNLQNNIAELQKQADR